MKLLLNKQQWEINVTGSRLFTQHSSVTTSSRELHGNNNKK